MAGGRGRGRDGPASGQLANATWEYDATIKIESKPSELFPPHPNIKKPAPITEKERRQMKHVKRLQDQIKRGPLYTKPSKRDPNAPSKTFGEDQFNRQYGNNRKADIDPFHGVETYSQRYAPKQRDLPQLTAVNFNKDLFPKELWATLEGTEGEAVRQHINESIVRKAAMMNGPSDKTKIVLEKIHNLTAGAEEEEDVDEEPEEEADEEFDDDEIGNDYNGEQYFDNGERGEEDEDVGGGDGDY